MNNIFKNAKFGEAFKTRKNRKAVYLGQIVSTSGACKTAYQFLIKGDELLSYYNKKGKQLYCEFTGSSMNPQYVGFDDVLVEENHETDIVSQWKR